MATGAKILQHTTVQIPSWPLLQDPNALTMPPYSGLPLSGVSTVGKDCISPYILGEEAMTALQRFLPSNNSDGGAKEADLVAGEYSSDEFRMYEFKVRRCPLGRTHDWTECPNAHPGEKARRRDPRRHHYSGFPCLEFKRNSGCTRGDACEFAHGVFETWLHPARYRTQPCKDGAACGRRVCFFAHSRDQLRVVLPPSPTSPKKVSGMLPLSPTSILVSPPQSPPSDYSSDALSPLGGVEGLMASMKRLHLSKVKSEPPFVLQRHGAWFNAGFSSVPTTPVRRPALERERQDEEAMEVMPDFGWVSELVN